MREKIIKELISEIGKTEIEAKGLAVTIGFINMLSWATTYLIFDGRALSDIIEGDTMEVFREGGSMGPVNEQMKEDEKAGIGVRYGSTE